VGLEWQRPDVRVGDFQKVIRGRIEEKPCLANSSRKYQGKSEGTGEKFMVERERPPYKLEKKRREKEEKKRLRRKTEDRAEN